MAARALRETGALVVGGTAGIGLASARALLRAGVPRVVVAGRSPARGEAVRLSLEEEFPSAEIGYLAVDATKPGELETIVGQAVARLGRIDVLVSTAGGDPRPRLLHQIPLDALMPTIEMVAGGTILPARAVLPHMMEQGGGSVICLASDAAKVATPGEAVIGAAMAAIVMFCRGMAWEAKRSGIRVNCLTPSVVSDTPLYGRLKEDPFSRKLFAKAETMADLGVVTAADLADLVVFLASPSAARITGQTISVTGGISAA
ncbi:SDR family oxidoreductase [Aquibium sp. ELW1220]|uniref:SDR family NAD(P)-dependent oxidoreductase n=1 Tax=Aquibium sp. ELW1220 TaxID=2976766 RepID=UPI0025B1A169|nr:SDR family oxidoreductase [Aquibium sp. ELW1220]MDN2583372.1 SDR family oxidoreductase [Aquibium sp. ELW1220]